MNTDYSWFTQPALRNRGSTNSNPNQLSLIDSLASWYQGQVAEQQQALETLSNWFNKPAQNTRGMSAQEAIQQYYPMSIQNGNAVAGTPIQEQANSIVNGNFIPPTETSPFKDSSLPDAQINTLLHQSIPTINKESKTNILGEQIPIQNLDSGVGYVNGKLFDSNKNSFSGMFDGYSKERDAAIDPKTGKIDRNSEFYKRNKKIMENL